MVRPTRRSARVAESSSTTTVTPVFSAQSSTHGNDSPDTSEFDDGVKTVSTKNASSKGQVLDNSKNSASERPARKRRVVAKDVYVDVPPLKTPSTKEKGKATNAGKAKAKSAVSRSSVVEDSDPPSQSELELVEDDDSGSEFEAKSASEYADSGDSSENEALMLSAAVEVSLQAARFTPGTASSSKTRLPTANPAAVAKAAAVERRLTRGRKMAVDEDDGYPGSEMDVDIPSSDSESEEEPITTKKGKAKAKPKGKGKGSAKASTGQVMTLAQVRVQRREELKLTRAERRANKAEERALVRQLGRSLTYAEKTTIALKKHHPELRDVWGDLEANIEIIQPQKAAQSKDLKITLLPFQQESLHWMREQEKTIWQGGMLADEMGMGKTIQMIALLVSDKKKPNLVVAPTVAIMQWRNEIATHTDGLKVLVWHGSTRATNIEELKKYDVVLTTYAVLESCFRKQESGFKRQGKIITEPSLPHQVKWNRIILDEAHNIKDRGTNTAKATFELKSNYKWCLSGTPLQNRVGELYSLIRFLGGDPFAFYFCKKCDCKSLHWKFSDKRSCDDCKHSPMQHTCFWNNEILSPIQKNGMEGPGKDAFKKLRILLDRMMLRRTKLQRADDLGLPPRTVIVRRDYFSPEEKELYLSLFSDAKRQFATYLDQGTILNNYSNIFSLLARMRQMACHPDLVLRSKSNANQFVSDDGEATVCRICHDVAEDAIQSKCRHIFDRECIKQYLETALENNPDCPVCHVPLTIDLEAPALELEENQPNGRQGILGRLNLDTWRSSTKIEALVEELSNLRMKDATTKSIVFSQFVNFLDLIAYRLQKAGFNVCRLEGSMSPQARDATIQHFMNNVHVTVFLVSLKAGGVALNLTEASRVYLMDSWWNPAVEYQAMDRIHRLGQRRPVEAIKLVVEDSIESRIVQLQEKKSAMVDATLSTDDSAMGRLTPEDLGFLFRL